MPVKDTFKYEARWDSVGLDCSNCQHFCGPTEWPDTGRVSRCKLHGVSLALELHASGYKQGEWFCQAFANSDKALAWPPAVAHLETIRQELEPAVLYGFYSADGYLVEHRMDQLEPHR